ncbi:quinone oxidoreductase family protein [Roseateles sp. NT4]|uniref:quinone oxidoreductase family protein n=1 Tax=Roseateles sp. NT4 TaxID=3453715 RepID=UPI003EEA3925
MRAIVVEQFGGPQVLALKDVVEPQPMGGEVAIKVSYAGVGFVDTLVRAGHFAFVKLPTIPGIEVAGHIHAVGEGVKGLRVGDPVAALLNDFSRGGMGGYAEIAIAKAALTCPVTHDGDLLRAAAVLVNGATALMALESLRPGASVAVSGATGGLGRCLLTAARYLGAKHVLAISSKEDQTEQLLQAGATEVIAPRDLGERAANFDVACDTVGGATRIKLLGLLQTQGQLKILGNASGDDPSLSGDRIWLRNITVTGLSTGGISHVFPERLAVAGRLALSVFDRPPVPPTVLSIDQAADAHRELENGRGGKFVLSLLSPQ